MYVGLRHSKEALKEILPQHYASIQDPHNHNVDARLKDYTVSHASFSLADKSCTLDVMGENSQVVAKKRNYTSLTKDDCREVLTGLKQSTKVNSYTGDIGVSQNVLTTGKFLPDIVRQKIYREDITRFVEVRRGFAPWASEIYSMAITPLGIDQFEKGFQTLGMASQSTVTNTRYEKWTVPQQVWRGDINYNQDEINFAKNNLIPFDLVQEKVSATFENYMKGIELFGLLGTREYLNPITKLPYTGLLNNTDIAANTTVMVNGASAPTKLSDMSFDEMQTAINLMIDTYDQNSGFTGMPNKFVISNAEKKALMFNVGTSQFGNTLTKYQWLENRLQMAYPGIEIVDSIYATPQTYVPGLTLAKEQYTLYRSGGDGMVMFESIPYTVGTVETMNGWEMNQSAYAQFSPVVTRRPLEAMYFIVNI